MSTALSNPMITPEEKVFHPKPPRLRLPPRMLWKVSRGNRYAKRYEHVPVQLRDYE